MARQLSEERFQEFVNLLAKKHSGINLDETQERFLRLIKERGVCVNMTKEEKNNPEYQELVNILAKMHKDGIIPGFQVVDAQ